MDKGIARFLEAQDGPEGINEAIRQIKSGEISGDWMVWMFPTYQSNLESILWAQNKLKPGYEEQLLELEIYALKDWKEAAAYVSDSTIKGNLKRICSVLLEYDIEYVFRVFDKWLTLLWSGLSTFEALCPECIVFHQLREKLFPDNKDLLSIMYFTPDRRKIDVYDKPALINEMQPSSAKERKRLERMLRNFSIEDRDGVRVTISEFLPIYFEGSLYVWDDLDRAVEIKTLVHTTRCEQKIVKDGYERLWLYSMFDDPTYDCRVVRAYINVNSVDEAKELGDSCDTILSESSCRPPYFFRENLDHITFVKPIPEDLTVEDEILRIVENTKFIQ